MQDAHINNTQRDALLVQKTLKNRDDFSELVQLYQEPIRRYIRRLGCSNPSDADDLLQEIFLKVYINLNDFDADLAFSSWLYRIAHNEAVSAFRKRSIRPKTVVTEDELDQFQNIADDLNIAEEFDKTLNAKVVQQAISELDEQYYDVLILKFMEEKSYTEISDILKIPMGTVATLIKRGKEQLKKILISKNINL